MTGGTAEIVDIYSNVVFMPDEDYAGPASVSWTVTDDGDPALSTSGMMSISVLPINDEPIALYPSYQTSEDVPFLFNLSDAVVDPDHSVQDLSITFFDEWLGTIEVLSDGQTAEFTPTDNLSGTIDIWFQAIDPAGAETWGSVTVEILPVNDAPTAADATYQMLEDEDIWISIDDLVDDVESDLTDLQFQFDAMHGGSVVQSVGGWNLIFTPDPNFNGPASFDFTVTDDGVPVLSASAHVDIDVVPVNDAPTASNGFVTTQASTPITIDLLDYASDVETPGEQLIFEVFGGCDGEAMLLSDGHSMTVIPDPGFTGEISVWYRVFDQHGWEEWGLIRVSVVDCVATDTAFEDWDLMIL
ncbi:MAG: tandem-95 repeat protein [Fuerstiella sp.]|nr:tandem-95 repeat protein [Fuerstiella sp.]MCP4854268.1 tandem-95 repeat protein [Fuerstiella sp.]